MIETLSWTLLIVCYRHNKAYRHNTGIITGIISVLDLIVLSIPNCVTATDGSCALFTFILRRWNVAVPKCQNTSMLHLHFSAKTSCTVHICFEITQTYFHFNYKVTIQVISSLPLTSKQKYCFNIRNLYYNATFVLVPTTGLTQPEWSPCMTVVMMC